MHLPTIQHETMLTCRQKKLDFQLGVTFRRYCTSPLVGGIVAPLKNMISQLGSLVQGGPPPRSKVRDPNQRIPAQSPKKRIHLGTSKSVLGVENDTSDDPTMASASNLFFGSLEDVHYKEQHIIHFLLLKQRAPFPVVGHGRVSGSAGQQKICEAK